MIRISVPLSFIILQESTAQGQLDSVTCGGTTFSFRFFSWFSAEKELACPEASPS
jgi:hypothetical protein